MEEEEGEGEGSFPFREVGTGKGVGREGLKPCDAYYLLHIPAFYPRANFLVFSFRSMVSMMQLGAVAECTLDV